MKNVLLTSESSTHLPHPTVDPAFNLAIEDTSLLKREVMSHTSAKWSTVFSHL